MFQRPTGFFRAKPTSLRVTSTQAEILLRAIEDNDGLKDLSRREQARSNLRAASWDDVKGSSGLSVMKKLVHWIELENVPSELRSLAAELITQYEADIRSLAGSPTVPGTLKVRLMAVIAMAMRLAPTGLEV